MHVRIVALAGAGSLSLLERDTHSGTLYEYQNKGDAEFAFRKCMERKDYFFRDEERGENQNGNRNGSKRRSPEKFGGDDVGNLRPTTA